MKKTYNLEYKEYVCRMVVEEGRKISELSRELDISRSALTKWVQEYKKDSGWVEKHEQQKKTQEKTIYKTPTDYEKEIKELKKDKEQLSEENQILKKAMHVFTESRE